MFPSAYTRAVEASNSHHPSVGAVATERTTIVVLSLAGLVLTAVGLLITLFGPEPGQSHWSALAGLLPHRRAAEPTPVPLTTEQEQYKPQIDLILASIPPTRDDVEGIEARFGGELRIRDANARVGALLIILGTSLSTVAAIVAAW